MALYFFKEYVKRRHKRIAYGRKELFDATVSCTASALIAIGMTLSLCDFCVDGCKDLSLPSFYCFSNNLQHLRIFSLLLVATDKNIAAILPVGVVPISEIVGYFLRKSIRLSCLIVTAPST